jgi:transposase-like protein
MGKWIKIELCPGCEGVGQTWDYGYANSVHRYDCKRCNNTGRVKVTTTREEEPFCGSSPEKDEARSV